IEGLLKGAIEVQRAPGGGVDGLAQLDLQIDVSVVVHSGTEEPDLSVRPEALGGARLDGADLGVRKAHARLCRAYLLGIANQLS
ncbi:MAG: hypothetical protein ACREXU_04505, partial [Gammaproteobacteria bacterium]